MLQCYSLVEQIEIYFKKNKKQSWIFVNKLVLYPRTMTYLFDTHLSQKKEIPISTEISIRITQNRRQQNAWKSLEWETYSMTQKKSQRVKPQQYINGNK